MAAFRRRAYPPLRPILGALLSLRPDSRERQVPGSSFAPGYDWDEALSSRSWLGKQVALFQQMRSSRTESCAVRGHRGCPPWHQAPSAETAWENNFATSLNARERQRTSVDDRAGWHHFWHSCAAFQESPFFSKGAQQLPADGIRLMSNSEKIIRLRTVLARTGLSRSTLYRKMAEGTFPARVKISVHGAGW